MNVALNTESKSKTFGEVELKDISFGDVKFFVELLDKAKDNKEFVILVLYHQLITPQVSFTEFSKISDEELIKLTRDFVRQEQHIFEHFKETTDAKFFTNFREAIKGYHQRQVEELQATIEPPVEPIKAIKFREALRIAESVGPVIKRCQSIVSNLAEFLTFWQRWFEQNKKIFDSYTKFWHAIQKQYRITEQEAIQILSKYKWFVTPSLPLNFVFKAVKIGRGMGNQRKAINKLFVDYFSSDNFKNLENLVDGWETNKMFKPRMKIFRDCFFAMRNAKDECNPSNFVIPTLIAQIDGIQREFMEQNGLSFNPERRRWEDKKGNFVDWKEWFKDQTSNQELLDLANDIFLNILFQKSYLGKPLTTPFTFSRHKIMHGEYLRYGRIANTIRAFLILDFLATLSK